MAPETVTAVPLTTSPPTPRQAVPSATLPPEAVPSATLPPEAVPSATRPAEAASPSATLPPEAVPSATLPPEAVPSATLPAEAASPSPSAEPTTAVAPPNASPRIIAVRLSKRTVHGGDTISGLVITSSNVASVEARIATMSITVPKIGPGVFKIDYVVPSLPFFLRNTYPMTVIARNTAGDAVESVVTITLR